MKKILIILCATFLIFGVVGTAGAYTPLANPGAFSGSATTIDFEGVAVGSDITNLYSPLGVTFSAVNGTSFPRIDNNESGGGQGANGGPADPLIYTSITQDAPLMVTFSGGAVAAGGAYYIDIAPFIGRGLFYDVNNILITTFILDQTVDFWGLRADPGDALIGSILFDSSGGYPEASAQGFGADVAESYTIDNLIFEAGAPVPIPGAVWLLGSGLIGLAGFRRKLKK